MGPNAGAEGVAATDEEKDAKAPFFVLLDDVISDQRLKYDSNLMELFVAGRHYRLFVQIYDTCPARGRDRVRSRSAEGSLGGGRTGAHPPVFNEKK